MVSEFKLWNIMFPTLPISQKFVNTNTWLIQLTQLFMANDTDLLKKEMNKATFSNDEISGVIFLKNLMAFNPANVFDTHKQFKNS